jgi:hypothetical protein
VSDQTANQTAKPLKKGEKKSPVLEQWNYSLSCSDVTPFTSSPVCLCLLGRFGGLLWQPEQEPGGAVIRQACRAGAQQGGGCSCLSWSWCPAGPVGWGSWQSMTPDVLPRAGAWQGLRGRGPAGRDLVQSWGLAQPEGWGSQWGKVCACFMWSWCPVGPRGRDPGRVGQLVPHFKGSTASQ